MPFISAGPAINISFSCDNLSIKDPLPENKKSKSLIWYVDSVSGSTEEVNRKPKGTFRNLFYSMRKSFSDMVFGKKKISNPDVSESISTGANKSLQIKEIKPSENGNDWLIKELFRTADENIRNGEPWDNKIRSKVTANVYDDLARHILSNVGVERVLAGEPYQDVAEELKFCFDNAHFLKMVSDRMAEGDLQNATSSSETREDLNASSALIQQVLKELAVGKSYQQVAKMFELDKKALAAVQRITFREIVVPKVVAEGVLCNKVARELDLTPENKAKLEQLAAEKIGLERVLKGEAITKVAADLGIPYSSKAVLWLMKNIPTDKIR